MKVKQVVPSVLTSDPDDLERKVRILERMADVIQIDIMDGKLVPSTSVCVGAVRRINSQVPLEIHLMVERPMRYIQIFSRIGAFRIIFHVESNDNPEDVIREIKQFNMEAGIALNPPTSVEKIMPYLDSVDLVLVMGVNPGFQGQKFIPEVLSKVQAVKKNRPDIIVEVDGGVNPDTAPELIEADVDILNVGSYLFKRLPVEDNWAEMQSAISIGQGSKR